MGLSLHYRMTLPGKTPVSDVRARLTALRDFASNMNRLMARFAGALSDHFGDEHDLQAPIFDHAEFEHLEMEPVNLPDQADGSK